jgi:iron complex outermembrane receptor protein
MTPNQRTNIFFKSEYGRAAPEPLFFGPEAGAGFILDNLVWPADHPFNPFGVELGPDNIFFTGRRPIEAGPRVFDQSVDTWYISGGIDGQFDFGDSTIYWDVTAIFSQNDASQVKQGAFNAQNIALALGPTDVCASTPGCVPLNWVGPNTMTQEMLDFVTFIQKDVSDQEMKDLTFNLTGEFGGLQAGNIGWAAGYEYRRETGSFTPDSIVSKGFTAGVPASPTAGGFEVDELYAELIVPLWRGDSGRMFDVSGAVRYSDYDLFDSETIYDIGLNFAPHQDLMFRASFSEGFRAPHIGELFNTGSRFDASVSDPCSNADAGVAANCAALGVPPGFEAPNPQTSVTTGGNDQLTPETSDTFTAGLTWDIAAADNWDGIDGLLFEFNYYDIEIDNAIQPPDAQDLLDQCVDTLDPFFCDAITRAPGGTITRIDGILKNIGGIETSGFDWKVELMTADTGLGQFRFQWLNTHLTDYVEITEGPDGAVRVDRAGTELGSPERGFVEWKSNFNIDWMMNSWSARLGFRYLDGLDEQCTGLVADFELTELCSNGADGNRIGSTLFTDAQVTFAPDMAGAGQWSFTLGVDNLFDEDIPTCFSCDLNSFDGTLYPIQGPFWYFRSTFAID